MKKCVLAITFLVASLCYSQEVKPTFKADGDLVKATYYFEDGSVKTQGYFKDKKLTGEWTRFDKNGNKVQLAYYKAGKKVGKWFIWNNHTLKEINYKNNTIVNAAEFLRYVVHWDSML